MIDNSNIFCILVFSRLINLGHKCLPLNHPSVSALKTLIDQLPKINDLTNHTKKEMKLLNDCYEEKRVEIDLFFEDLKSILENRRLELQQEWHEVCERERERLTNLDMESTKSLEKCESLLNEIKTTCHLAGHNLCDYEEFQSQLTSNGVISSLTTSLHSSSGQFFLFSFL